MKTVGLRFLSSLAGMAVAWLAPTLALAQPHVAEFPEEPPAPLPQPAPTAPEVDDVDEADTAPLPTPDPDAGWTESETEEGGGNDPLGAAASAPLTHERLAAWKGDYERAKQLMRQGHFQEAQGVFEGLALRAPNAAEGAAARELAALCAYWHTHGLRLMLPEHDEVPAPDPLPRTARRSTAEIASLYVNAVAYGLGTGVWLAVLSKPDTEGGFFLPTLLATGAAVGTVALFDRGEGLRYGVPQSISSGMYVGLSQGLLWSLAHNARAPYAEMWSPETVATLTWGGATLGAIAGGVIGENAGTTPGRAAWVGSTALWGGILGGLTVGGSVSDDVYADEKALYGAAIVSTAGTIGGLLTAGSISPSLARVRFIDLGGLGGALLGLGLYATAAEDRMEPQETMWAMNLGAATGLITAWVLTSAMEPDRGSDRSDDARPSTPSSPLLTARPTILPAAGGGQLGLVGMW